MSLKLNVRGIDLDKSAAGVWVEYEDRIEFKIARANTPAYRDDVRKIMRQHKRQIEGNTLSDEKSDKIMADLMAEHLLLDWKGLKNGKEDFPYSKENAKAFLNAEEYSDIKEWIMKQAQDVENFRSDNVKK